MQLQECLNIPLFSDLNTREKNILISNSTVLKYHNDELILKKDSKLYGLYYVAKGFVKLKDRRDQMFCILKEGEFFGQEAIYCEEMVHYSAFCLDEAEILQIDMNTLNHLFTTNNKFFYQFFKKRDSTHRSLISSLLDFKRCKINGALASFLLHYSQRGCLHHLTRKDIGEILGYSRENITKVIKTFEDEELIKEENKTIQILNYDALQTIRKNG